MSIRKSTTRAGLLAVLAAGTLLGAGGTANAAGGLDWDLWPSGSVEIGPPTGSSMGSVDADFGSGTGSFDADLGSAGPRPPSTGSAVLPGSAG
ncbi:hypothetical protein ATM97_24415 [Nocardia sp. MH4]|jgi:hypothetical protein|uniref:hypothetical protein n=1 Tax=unclassified Nocardia TaxID=2637762 RepID=UPI001C4EEA13|nr:hypothetical protein [Nocardia sp. MH4]MBW0273230.1 hypothetical protein [Nocardia sp. MH4]